ncbi:hypothetical protein cce_3130 [Crocosphaera subtropica ATCC 51142]|uniref:Uncharacterized protein n=2 Tax=Crocosphaera TaxID=263510 RepID=B1WX09_CROS5|nr:hypothetical protein cce_3130 [Crocosphaera subtropica ATCC 51142]
MLMLGWSNFLYCFVGFRSSTQPTRSAIAMSLIIRLLGYKIYDGILDKITDINEQLKQIGLSTYNFCPDRLPDDIVLPWLNISFSDINLLKNVFLELEANPDWTPESDSLFIGERIFFLSLAKEIFTEKQSHLLWHHNYFGCYVPIDFKDVLLPDDFLTSMGSSIQLKDELTELADKLKLDLGNYTPDFELLYEQRIYELENDPLGFEKMLLLCLYNFCLASIKYNLIIEF